MQKEELKTLVAPADKKLDSPYLHPFTMPAEQTKPYNVFLIGSNPATPICSKDMPSDEYVDLLLSEEQYDRVFKQFRLNKGRTGVSRTRLGTNSMINQLEAATGENILRTNVLTYPTAKAKALKAIPSIEIDRSKQLFMKMLLEHHPSVLIACGSTSFQHLIEILSNEGLLDSIPSMDVNIHELEKSNDPLIRFTYQNEKEGAIFACRHLMYFGDKGDSYKEFMQTVTQYIHSKDEVVGQG